MPSPSPFHPPIHATTHQPPPTITILLLNPNSTPSMTAACLSSVTTALPPHTTLVGFTAPHPAPTAIESATDAILSAETCIRALAAAHTTTNSLETPTGEPVDAILVACFSAHPLIPALRERYAVPVIGIMEAALYGARMLGGTFGIVATSQRSKLMQRDAVASYGLTGFYAGSEATGLGVLELETEGGMDRVGEAARRLVANERGGGGGGGGGADCILLGCAGMTEMREACRRAVKGEGIRDKEEKEEERRVNVIDGVEVGVHFLIALVRVGLATSKGGVYRSADEGRRARGQDWL